MLREILLGAVIIYIIFHFYSKRKKKKQRLNETLRIKSVIRCEKCKTITVRDFQKGDYFFKTKDVKCGKCGKEGEIVRIFSPDKKSSKEIKWEKYVSRFD